MLFDTQKLKEIDSGIDQILEKIQEFEQRYEKTILNAHPKYKLSAKNLIHYLALRSCNVDQLQKKLRDLGISTPMNSELSVLHGLLNAKTIVRSLLYAEKPQKEQIFLSHQDAKQLLKTHTIDLFGIKRNDRNTSILVTQPSHAADNPDFVRSLLKSGMDCARVNCAHDSEDVWQKIIENIKNEESACKIMMDLGGPKLRTGKIKPGLKIIRIKPKKDALGKIVAPAKIWLAPYGVLPNDPDEADAIIPVNKKWLKKTKPGSYIRFRDYKGKKCRFNIREKEGLGRWATSSKSAIVSSDTLFNVFNVDEESYEIQTVQELLPLEEVIYLHIGDHLRLDKNPIPGETTKKDKKGNLIQMAHISCTHPEIFDDVQIDEPIYFDDGTIEGIIKEIHSDHLIIQITNAKKKGGKLKADKGINLPLTHMSKSGLTEKDREDLKFVVQYSDAVNFSFVNKKEDVSELLDELEKLEAKIGIVLKIETRESYKNLPSILLKAMENYPIGVMIARGDLAIETGWKDFAIVQEEILRLCEAAHIPDIWATQVLENLAQKGIPTRSEITDAAMAQRAECVMLNKGPHIQKAVKMLDKILKKMQKIQKKNAIVLPKLEFSENL